MSVPMAPCPRSRGFTLLELVVALSISAILVGFIAMLVSTPVDAYIDQSERARLTDGGETLSRRFSEDLNSALPKSVRIHDAGSRWIVEMLRVEGVSFYALPLSTPEPDRDFDVGLPNDTFYSYGRFRIRPASYLVVGNLDTGVLVNVYAGAGIASSFDVEPGLTEGQERIALRDGSVFHDLDPRNRLFWVSGPVTYICDATSNVRTLRRYSGYSINAAIPTSSTSSALSGAASELIASDVRECRFECGVDPDRCQHVFVLEATIGRPAPNDNEAFRILEQIALR